MSRKPTEIRVYWTTTRAPTWAFLASDENGQYRQETIQGVADDDLDWAIDKACYELDLDIDHHSFARDPISDGGFGIWTAGGIIAGSYRYSDPGARLS